MSKPFHITVIRAILILSGICILGVATVWAEPGLPTPSLGSAPTTTGSTTSGQNAPTAPTGKAGAQSSNSASSAASNNSTGSPGGGMSGVIRQIGGQTALPSYDAGHSKQSYQPGAAQLTSVIYFILDFFKYIFGGVAVLTLIVSGLKLILAGRQAADAMSKEKETLRLSFTGLIIMLVADQLIRVFFGLEGEVYRTGTDMQLAAEAGTEIAKGASNLIRIFLPSVAVAFTVIAGFRLLLARGDNDELGKAKKQITWAIIGLVLAGLAEIIVFRVVFPDRGSRIPDAIEFNRLLVTMTNFISGFISTLSVLAIIYAGYLYVVSLGGDQVGKAKTILTGAFLGLLLSMAAFGLVNTFVKIDPLPSTTSSPVRQTQLPGL